MRKPITMAMRCRAFLLISAACAVLSAPGCGERPVVTSGTVTFDGKPLANATVMFIAEEPTVKTATGYTDAVGAFAVTTLPGLYKVTVHHSEPIKVAPGKTPDEYKRAIEKANELRKPSEVPLIYAREDQTPLRHRVPQDGPAKFALSRTPE